MDFRITISVSEVGGIYSAKDMDEANKIAQSICDDIYMRLKGKCSVFVESVTEA